MPTMKKRNQPENREKDKSLTHTHTHTHNDNQTDYTSQGSLEK